MYKKPILIAEVGCNHKGDFEIAKKFIEVAVDFCKLKYIKFQKRDNKSLFSTEEYNAPHPVYENSYGKTYGEHRDALEFDLNQHKELFKECLKKKNHLFIICLGFRVSKKYYKFTTRIYKSWICNKS